MPRMRTTSIRSSLPAAEFLNRKGKGTKTYGRHAQALEEVLATYFGTLEGYNSPLDTDTILDLSSDSRPKTQSGNSTTCSPTSRRRSRSYRTTSSTSNVLQTTSNNRGSRAPAHQVRPLLPMAPLVVDGVHGR